MSYPQAWMRCDTHGAPEPTAWGCPECVSELRADVERLTRERDEAREELDGLLVDLAKPVAKFVKAERAEARAAAIEAAAKVADARANRLFHSQWVRAARDIAERIRALAAAPEAEAGKS